MSSDYILFPASPDCRTRSRKRSCGYHSWWKQLYLLF